MYKCNSFPDTKNHMNGIVHHVFVMEHVNRIKFGTEAIQQHTVNLMNFGQSRFKHTGKQHNIPA